MAGEFAGGLGGGSCSGEGSGFDNAEVLPDGTIGCAAVVAQVPRVQGKVARR